jgi:surface protein
LIFSIRKGNFKVENNTQPFIIKVKTDNPGTSNNNQFRIPTNPSYTYDYTVEQYDDLGNVLQTLENQTGYVILTWDVAGTYLVKIYPKSDGSGFPSIFFNNVYDKSKLLDVTQWGTNKWTSMYYGFFGCNNLTGFSATDKPDLSNVTDMYSMFYGATSFNQDISGWDVSNVTNMSNMFNDATSFNGDVSSWNVSNVTSMSAMFRNATSFNGDVSSWNVSKVTNMSSMFRNATSFNGDNSNWNVSNVTSMSLMFYGAKSFNQDISSWNVSNVTSMRYMFNGATSFNGDISNWDVSNVTDMTYMFSFATSFNQDLTQWCVRNILNEPDSFALNSALTPENYPVWGTCPGEIE